MGNLKQINSNESPFSESLEELSLDDLVTAIDKAISRAEEILPPDIQTHQTIFGVKDNWVDNETKKIKKEYLEKLKKVCAALDLTPIGFMVTTEAITHLMQEEEGAPVSAVFAEVGKKYVNLNLLRGGKIVESVTSPHLESIPLTVDKLLGHFTVPVLPARIIIFQSKPNERTAHSFLTHQWSKHLPFLHVPQVTVLPPSFDMRSVMAGAATQMGFTVVESKHEELPKFSAAEIKEEVKEEHEMEQASFGENELPSEEAPFEPGVSDEEAIADAEAASDFGFVVDQDISDHKPQAPLVEDERLDTTKRYDESLAGKVDDKEQQSASSRSVRKVVRTSGMFAGISALKLPKNFKMPAFDKLFGGIKGSKSILKIAVPAVIVMILIVGTIFFYYNKMQANVLLIMKPDAESQDETVTFSTAESSDFSHNLIAAKSVSTSIAGQVSTPASGSKDEGDKAKGTVTIYNNNSNSVTA